MFQRLVAIPQEEYLSMSNMKTIHQPLTQHFQNLQKQYTQTGEVRDPYERLILQSETLDQLKDIKDRIRQSLTVSTPKPYQNRAKALFQSMESFLKFNDRGELIDEAGKVIPSSRVEDLIQHAVRDRRRNMTPLGWDQFRNLLREHNVPKSILNRNTLDEMEDETKPLERKKLTTIKRRIAQTGEMSSTLKRAIKRENTSPMKLREKKPMKYDTNFLKTY